MAHSVEEKHKLYLRTKAGELSMESYVVLFALGHCQLKNVQVVLASEDDDPMQSKKEEEEVKSTIRDGITGGIYSPKAHGLIDAVKPTNDIYDDIDNENDAIGETNDGTKNAKYDEDMFNAAVEVEERFTGLGLHHSQSRSDRKQPNTEVGSRNPKVDISGQGDPPTDYTVAARHRTDSPASLGSESVRSLSTSVSDNTANFSFVRINSEVLQSFGKLSPTSSEYKAVSSVSPPALISSDKTLILMGICGIIRFLLKDLDDRNPVKNLLGFRQSCLGAPAEVSVWTRFCEVETVEALKTVRSDEFPTIFPKFENHLNEPVRMHNVMKKVIRENGIKTEKTKKDGKGRRKPGVEEANVEIENLDQERMTNKIRTEHMLNRKESAKEQGKETQTGRNQVEIGIIEGNVDHLIEKPDEVRNGVTRGTQSSRSSQSLKDLQEKAGALLDHKFAEGLELTLADLVLFPFFDILFHCYKETDLAREFPAVHRWYTCMKELSSVSLTSPSEYRGDTRIIPTVPPVTKGSLYLRDSARSDKVGTDQSELDKILGKFKKEDLSFSSVPLEIEDCFDWSKLPPEAHPIGGDLPDSRVVRKCEQLQNIILAVMKIAKVGDIIVDFCSGGGHLGIVLAFLLPTCQVVMIDNKSESVARARSRVRQLQLGNITLILGNINYFKGAFSIGVSLHACGSATDIVLNTCIAKSAGFVICPCCYGGVRPSQALAYPQSKRFKEFLSSREYSVLAHCADQTHEKDNRKTEQGYKCMDLTDMDRVMFAVERGYKVCQTKLKPETCSPKNNLLIGILD